jgi:tetratricopeptide (TPR) repeat protein
MSHTLLDPPQRQIVNRIGWLAAVLLAGSALFGQTNPSSRPRGWDHGQPAHQFDWNDIPMTSTAPQQPHDSSNTVTFQALHHKVPKKALKEMKKAQRARAKNGTDEAIGHLKQAISIAPEFVAARNNLAAIYLRAAQPEPAIAQLEEAVKIDPKNPGLFRNLAVGYTMINNLEAAERAARVTVGLDRTGGRAPMLLGYVLMERRKFTEEALQCFERARDEYPLAHLLAARVLVAQGHSERAKSEIYTYLSSKEQNFRATATRWLDLIDQGQQKSAAVLPH